MHWRGEEGGWGQEKQAHLFGYLGHLWGSSGVRGFITKLHCSMAIAAVAGISAQISTQIYLLPNAGVGQTCGWAMGELEHSREKSSLQATPI